MKFNNISIIKLFIVISVTLICDLQTLIADNGMTFKPIAQIQNNSSKVNEENVPFNSEDLLNAIQGFLDTLHKHDIRKAYDNFASQDFKNATTFKEFEKFISDYPIFANSISFVFTKVTFVKNIGTYSGLLSLPNHDIYPVDFNMTQIDGKWKILHIQVYSPVLAPKKQNEGSPSDNSNPPTPALPVNNPKPTVSPTNFIPEVKNQNIPNAPKLPINQNGITSLKEITLGTDIDARGSINKPLKIVPGGKEDIYINVSIENALKGSIISVTFSYLDTNSKISPISSTLQEDGVAFLPFVFSSPPDGWPVGNYEVRASLSGGNTLTNRFQIGK